MSSILKALKKVEEEKQTAGGPRDQLPGYAEPSLARQQRPWKTLLLLVCGILLGVVAATGIGVWLGSSPEREAFRPGAAGELTAAPAARPDEPVEAAAPVAAESSRPDRQAARPTAQDSAAGTGSIEPAAAIADALPAPGKEEALPAASLPSEPASAVTAADSATAQSSADPGRAVSDSPDASPAAIPGEKMPAADVAAAPVLTSSPEPAESSFSTPAGEGEPEQTGPASRTTAKARDPATRKIDVSDRSASATAVENPAMPPFRVSEIFFQPDGGSMAIVDDLPVMEGTVVNGVLIEKILPDRVRFLVEGRRVAIPVSSGQP